LGSFLALGFRPFYLLGALFGALAMVPWLAQIEGRIGPFGFLSGVLWHQHEMVFGFALAVIAGFLMTAGRLWTGLATPVGLPLALLAVHWLAARIAMATGPALLALAIDGSFPFVLAAVMGWVILGSRNARNYFIVALLLALGIANLAFHLGYPQSVKAALYLVLVLVVVMAARVVPAFTANALPRETVVRRPKLDQASVAVTLLAFLFEFLEAGPWVVVPLALAAAVMHLVRQAGWAPLATRGQPLLWIMHLSHAWFPVGFVLLALASLGVIPLAPALHAFGMGAMGGMILAMITRTALGHTARPLAAGRAEVATYVLLHAASLVRVVTGLAPQWGYIGLTATSGLLWAGAFIVYFIVYLPRLTQPRLDGKPG
jgi:uncharacterized protein involved in response to NO